jgi:hypothetical protein
MPASSSEEIGKVPATMQLLSQALANRGRVDCLHHQPTRHHSGPVAVEVEIDQSTMSATLVRCPVLEEFRTQPRNGQGISRCGHLSHALNHCGCPFAVGKALPN